MNTIRDFMPGDCSLGPEAVAFEAVDHAQTKTPDIRQKIEIAKLACLGCDQVDNCREQINGIEDVLSARAEGSQFVIGGEVADRIEPKEPDPVLNEPNFVFDLARVPDDPRQQLEIIRQGFRSGQLSTKGVDSKHQPALAAHLREQLIRKRQGQEKDSQPLADMAARIALKYLFARRHALSRRQSVAEPTLVEIRNAEKLQEVFVSDIEALDAMGALGSLVIGEWHKPEFFERVMQVYAGGYDMTAGRVRDIFRSSPHDPLSKIKEMVAKRRQLKEAANNEAVSKSDLAILNEGGRSIVRSREAKRSQGLHRYGQQNPALRPYITLIAKRKIEPIQAEATVKDLRDTFRQLQDKHQGIADVVLAHIAFRREDHEKAIEDFRQNMKYVREKYGAHIDFDETIIQRFVFEIADVPRIELAIEAYFDKLSKIREVGGAINRDLSEPFIRQLASYYEQAINEENVAFEYRKYRLKDLKKFRSLDGWMGEKVARLYGNEEYEVAAESLVIFLKRGYLRAVFATEEMPSTQYDYVDASKGRYIAWSDEFLAFTPDEREAILCASNLERLVLGRDVDEKRLKKRFDTDDIRKYADEYLLPYTLPKPLDVKDPASVLDFLRHWSRGNTVVGLMKATLKQQCGEVTAQLIEFLQTQDTGHDLYDSECRAGLNSLVGRVARWSPAKLRNKKLMQKLAIAYLSDVSDIQAHGLNRAHKIAHGYNAAFCDYFITLVDKRFTVARASELLERSTMQAMLLLRQYQKAVLEYEPKFKARRLSRGYCAAMAFKHRQDPQTIDNALLEYDGLCKTFKQDKIVNISTIRQYCFSQSTVNGATAAIEAWRTSITELDPIYRQKVKLENIRRVAYIRSGEALTRALDDKLELIDQITQEYHHKPHPGVALDIIEYAVFHSASPRKWLTQEYLVRWEYVQRNIDTKDIPLPILRRLILMGVKAPLNTVKAYRSLHQRYENDAYISSKMVDDAVVWSLKRAAASLAHFRARLRKEHEITNSSHYENSTMSSASYKIDATTSPAEFVVEKISNRESVATALDSLPVMEKAVIAAVFDLPWLVPADLRDESAVDIERVIAHYKVGRFDELEPIANAILARLKPKAGQ